MLHSRVVEMIPSHGLPPVAGGGLSHFRVLVWFPPPQIDVQVDQPLHSPHSPSSGIASVPLTALLDCVYRLVARIVAKKAGNYSEYPDKGSNCIRIEITADEGCNIV